MKTIQFNIETGMLAAVKDGRKTQTCTTLANQGDYAVGDVLAVVEPYLLVQDKKTTPFFPMFPDVFERIFSSSKNFHTKQGDPDKFPAGLARTFIKITGLQVKKPCDFTDEEFEAEGIAREIIENEEGDWLDYICVHNSFMHQNDCFLSLLCAIYGEERGTELFESEMLISQFVLCDRDGKEVVK